MAADRYFGTSKASGLAEWGTSTEDFMAGSVTDAATDNAGLFTGDTFYDGTGGTGALPGMTEGYGMSDIGSAFGSGWDMLSGGLDTITGLAGLWMDWDKLQSAKASARDSHNASAEQYNNYLKRSKNTTLSQGLVPTSGANARTDVARSTV